MTTSGTGGGGHSSGYGGGRSTYSLKSRQSSFTSSKEDLAEKRAAATLTRKNSGIPVYSPIKSEFSYSNGSPRQIAGAGSGQTPPARSNSAIDASAVRRASVRAQYAMRGRVGLTPQRFRKSSDSGGGGVLAGKIPPGIPTPDRNGGARTGRPRMTVTHSQPGSRSTSPTSLSSYATYFSGQTKNSPRKRSVGGNYDGVGGGVGADGSDESETSSICSEKSYPEYGRRSSDYGLRGGDSRERLYWDPMVHDIGDIIANCASTHWADRKDGLIGLQGYFRDGRMLSGSELRRVTEIFGRMFMDAHTKVFTLFLDTLIELVLAHKADLGDWLHILLTGLLNKLGGDLLGSIIQKINRTLDIVRDSFTLGEQMTVLMRFVGDSALTPNAKVKIATMKHLSAVAQLMEPSQVKTQLMLTSQEQEMALAKVITWTYEPKSAEVRRQSQAALVALFQLNPAHFARVMQALPKVVQENASTFVSFALGAGGASASGGGSQAAAESVMNESTATLTPEGMSRDSPEGNEGDDIMSTSVMKPSRMSNTTVAGAAARKSPYSRTSSSGFVDPVDDSENLNPEDVHQSLRSTANAIQNYTFDSAVAGTVAPSAKTFDSSSSASSLSKGTTEDSAVDGGLPEDVKEAADLEKKMSTLSLGSNNNNHNNGDGVGDEVFEDNSVHKQNIENLARAGEEGRAAIQEIIDELQCVKTQSRSVERKACMTQLIRMSREGQHTLVIQEHFRALLRLLLENLNDEAGTTRALVFGVLTEMLKQETLIASFQGFTELIILKVLESHRDPEKDVERAAEGCAGAMAGVLPIDLVLRVLNPIIKTGDFPVNQAAIKMLTKVAERESSKEVISHHLEDIMPGLLKAYDNVESSVRKASVFCMVSLHQLVGDSLQPHLASLNGSKLKLLNLYIKRAQAQSTPASPRLTTPP